MKSPSDPLNVQDDLNESSGVYAIIEFTSFHIFCHTGFPEKSEGGCGGYILWDELSIFISLRVPEAIFWSEILVLTTMDEIIVWRGQGRYLGKDYEL